MNPPASLFGKEPVAAGNRSRGLVLAGPLCKRVVRFFSNAKYIKYYEVNGEVTTGALGISKETNYEKES